ncbi:MAG: response regulator [Candidatus Omnitrophica bacterium]|nr:response regulator [Candidatus Omnitrophota bacterium]
MKKPHKILIIDDDPITIKLLEKWLINAGKTVIFAKTGEQGQELAKREKPDLILLDLMLPGQTGTNTAFKLIQDTETKDTPIIFITAIMGVENDKGDESIEIKGRPYRAFAKPLHRMKLLSEIRKQINKKINRN